MSSQQASPDNAALSSKDRFLHLKSMDVTFSGQRPNSKLEFKLKVASLKHKSPEIQLAASLHWDCEVYVDASTISLLAVQKTGPIRRSSDIIASFPLDFQSAKFADDMSIELKDEVSGATATIILGDAKSTSDVTRLLARKATLALASKIHMLENFSKVLGCLNFAVEIGKEAAQSYPVLLPVVPIVTGALKRLQKVPDCHRELVSIMDDVTSVLPLVERALELARIKELKEVIKDYFDIVRNLSEKIMEEYSISNSKLLFQSTFKSSKVDANGLSRRMTQWRENVNLALGTDIQQGVVDVQQGVEDVRQGVVKNQRAILDIHEHQLSKADEKSLEQLKPPERSWYDLDRRCLEGTRESVIQEVVQWSQSTDTSSRLFWLQGVAGCGKSSVATSVADRLHELKDEGVLSYSFFCKRDDPERRRAIRMIRAIAYYLASAFEPYRAVLLQKLREKPTPLNNMLQNEFKALLLDCIKETSGSGPPPIVITLDALDECDEMEKVSKFLVDIIRSTSWIKLIVMSRPLQPIQEGLESSGTLLFPYDLFGTPATADILVYTKRQFEDGGKLAILRKYVTPADIEELARKALGLFIWITVVCSYIDQRKSEKLDRFKAVIQSTNASDSEKQLDELYLQVLDRAAGLKEIRASKSDIRLIVAVVLATSRNRPLPAEALFAFGSPEYRGLREEWQDMLQDLRSVLITDTRTNAIRVCHKSFLDFLGSQERSGEFWTEPKELEQLMAKQCLRIMLAPSGLRFNISELKTSYLPNRDVKDLNVDQYIPRELQYSCLFWLDHLSKCDSGFSAQASIQDMLHRIFCQAKSLYWLEVLSLLSELREAGVILQKFKDLLKCSKSWSETDELYRFANDLYRFVKVFHEGMAMSTPHIYISALAWAPSESVITKSIGRTFNSRACLLDGHNEHWPNNIQTILVNSEVYCVAYSPDGRFIVSGSSDGTIRIWDAETGVPAGEPLRGHDGMVGSVNYSPDGRRIVSGSDDGTIRVWDAETGAPLGESLRGHDGEVWSVNYSRDGRRIVSGSEDRTIRIWDAEANALVASSPPHQEDAVCLVSAADSQTVSTIGPEIHTSYDMSSWEKGQWKYSVHERCFVSGNPEAPARGIDSVLPSRVPREIPPDGWIRTTNDDLMLWIPPEHRHGVCDMSLYCVPRNTPGRHVEIDWKRLCYGTTWATVKGGD